MKTTKTLLAAAILSIGLLPVSFTAQATTINVTNVRSGGSYAGVAFDSATGSVYEKLTYNKLGAFTRYANAAAFESGASSGELNSSSNFYGTYIAANNGSVYGRTSSVSDSYGWPNDAQTTKISGVSGASEATITVAGMGGSNGSDTFGWGGFSGVNVMNDGSHLYVVGGIATSNDWRIAGYDYSLNALSSASFTPVNGGGSEFGSAPGWGFAINGSLFLGDNHASGHISQRINAATGASSAVDFTLTGFGSNLYITNASYDVLNDALYLHSYGGGGAYYKVSGASQAFGAPAPAVVPVPAAAWLLGPGLLGLVGVARRKAA